MMMMKKKTQRIVGGVIAVLVTISMVGAGMFGYFVGGGVPQTQNSSSASSPVNDYNNFKSRVDTLNQLAKTNPNDIGLQQDLGNAYYDLASAAQQIAPSGAKENFNQAIIHYQNVLKTKKDINVLTDMATAAFYGEQSDLADKTFKEALALQPDFEQALFNYGVFLTEVKQDYLAAINIWQKALDNNPKGPNSDRFKQLISQTKLLQEAKENTYNPSSNTPSTTTPPNTK